MRHSLQKIISGGQTGADRGALDAAISVGFPVGGWCPAGRRAEDGAIPEKYPLSETKSDQYAQRTEYNVQDADGTLVVLFRKSAGKGTKLTEKYCLKHKRSCLKLNIEEKDTPGKLIFWLRENRIETLNVAGNRESDNPGIYYAVFNLILKLLTGDEQ